MGTGTAPAIRMPWKARRKSRPVGSIRATVSPLRTPRSPEAARHRGGVAEQAAVGEGVLARRRPRAGRRGGGPAWTARAATGRRARWRRAGQRGGGGRGRAPAPGPRPPPAPPASRTARASSAGVSACRRALVERAAEGRLQAEQQLDALQAAQPHVALERRLRGELARARAPPPSSAARARTTSRTRSSIVSSSARERAARSLRP